MKLAVHPLPPSLWPHDGSRARDPGTPGRAAAGLGRPELVLAGQHGSSVPLGGALWGLSLSSCELKGSPEPLAGLVLRLSPEHTVRTAILLWPTASAARSRGGARGPTRGRGRGR